MYIDVRIYAGYKADGGNEKARIIYEGMKLDAVGTHEVWVFDYHEHIDGTPLPADSAEDAEAIKGIVKLAREAGIE